MLLRTVLALESHLKGMNTVVPNVKVVTDEGYAEIIALIDRDKSKRNVYPLIVMRSGNYVIDRSRYTNDNVSICIRKGEYNGETVYYNEFDEPYLPYNLEYRIDLISETRREIDSMVMWVMQNIKDRDCLDVSYKGYDGNDAIYQSLVKRGDIIKADDKDGNVITLHRRIFELKLTTLIEAGKLKSEILVKKVKPNTYHLYDKE